MSYRTRDTFTGSTNDDEMCNFYIMYYRTKDGGGGAKGKTEADYNPDLWASAPAQVAKEASTFDGVYYPQGPLTPKP